MNYIIERWIKEGCTTTICDPTGLGQWFPVIIVLALGLIIIPLLILRRSKK